MFLDDLDNADESEANRQELFDPRPEEEDEEDQGL